MSSNFGDIIEAFDKKRARIESNHLVQLDNHNFRIKLAGHISKLIEATYQLNIQLPTQLEIYATDKLIEANSARTEAETNVLVNKARLIGHALIDYRNSERLAEARGLSRIASAWSDYLKASINDQLAACLLALISRRFNVDPHFRFKLERPLPVEEFNHQKKHLLNSEDA